MLHHRLAEQVAEIRRSRSMGGVDQNASTTCMRWGWGAFLRDIFGGVGPVLGNGNIEAISNGIDHDIDEPARESVCPLSGDTDSDNEIRFV